MKYDVAVIGGGAAGMMAAGTAAGNRSVILIEQNDKLGKKLYLTGKGRCNITNNSTIEDVIKNTVVNGRFLRNSLYKFAPEAVIRFFESKGLKTVTERGDRVFPLSGKSSDVNKVLTRYLEEQNVFVQTGRVTALKKQGDSFFISTENSEILAEKVIIATGGRSYSSTGSTGDGYALAAEFGHTIISPKPSLVPLIVVPEWKSKIGRLNLRNIRIKISAGDKQLFTAFGEMEINDNSVSGPVILSASSQLRSVKGLQLSIDLKPALSEQQLDARLIRDLEKKENETLDDLLPGLIPLKLRAVILEESGLSADLKCSSINRQKRKQLVKSLKNLNLKLVDFGPFREAIITSGGVAVKEINPMTMESRLIAGLYFAGEVIDVDALTGGFNLQIAWSTGFTAGSSC